MQCIVSFVRRFFPSGARVPEKMGKSQLALSPPRNLKDTPAIANAQLRSNLTHDVCVYENSREVWWT